LYLGGTTEEIGPVTDSVFGFSATSVSFTIDELYVNGIAVVPQITSIFDLLYRDNSFVYLGLVTSGDPTTTIPRAVNFNLPYRYTGVPVFQR